MANSTSKITAGLVALILASAGGAAFLQKHPDPTLRDVFLACEKGEVSGVACCEDMGKVKDWNHVEQDCGMITATNHDPLGFREQEENDWDKAIAEGK